LFDTCSTKSRGGHAKACSPLGTYLKVIVHSQSRAIVQTLVCQAPFPSRLQRRRLNKAIMGRTETPDDDCMYSTARVGLIREDRASQWIQSPNRDTQPRNRKNTNTLLKCNALVGAYYGTVSLDGFPLRSTSRCILGLTVQRSEW
jgi:hypothetical protein